MSEDEKKLPVHVEDDKQQHPYVDQVATELAQHMGEYPQLYDQVTELLGIISSLDEEIKTNPEVSIIAQRLTHSLAEGKQEDIASTMTALLEKITLLETSDGNVSDTASEAKEEKPELPKVADFIPLLNTLETDQAAQIEAELRELYPEARISFSDAEVAELYAIKKALTDAVAYHEASKKIDPFALWNSDSTDAELRPQLRKLQVQANLLRELPGFVQSDNLRNSTLYQFLVQYSNQKAQEINPLMDALKQGKRRRASAPSGESTTENKGPETTVENPEQVLNTSDDVGELLAAAQQLLKDKGNSNISAHSTVQDLINGLTNLQNAISTGTATTFKYTQITNQLGGLRNRLQARYGEGTPAGGPSDGTTESEPEQEKLKRALDAISAQVKKVTVSASSLFGSLNNTFELVEGLDRSLYIHQDYTKEVRPDLNGVLDVNNLYDKWTRILATYPDILATFREIHALFEYQNILHKYTGIDGLVSQTESGELQYANLHITSFESFCTAIIGKKEPNSYNSNDRERLIALLQIMKRNGIHFLTDNGGQIMANSVLATVSSWQTGAEITKANLIKALGNEELVAVVSERLKLKVTGSSIFSRAFKALGGR